MENNIVKVKYHSLNRWLQQTYGCKVYKVSVDGGFTCPNRDGTKGTGGCIFCSAGGSGEFSGGGREGCRTASISQQIELGKQLISKKLKNKEAKYIAYFQAFTNTYGAEEELRKKYFEAAHCPDICCISIATRPDCLQGHVIKVLKELNDIIPVWVELGLQTIHDTTADYIRRGFNLPEYDNAVRELNNLGIHVVAHVILGLPGETKEMMLDTVSYVCSSGAKGIKLQLLHVLMGTDLEREYESGAFACLTLQEYTEILCDCLMILPDDMIVHRVTGDGDKRLLIAPLWSGDKKRILNYLHRYIEEV